MRQGERESEREKVICLARSYKGRRENRLERDEVDHVAEKLREMIKAGKYTGCQRSRVKSDRKVSMRGKGPKPRTTVSIVKKEEGRGVRSLPTLEKCATLVCVDHHHLHLHHGLPPPLSIMMFLSSF